MPDPLAHHRTLVAALLDTIRKSATPPPTDRQIAWAIDQYSDAELLAYQELDGISVKMLRRWAATTHQRANGTRR